MSGFKFSFSVNAEDEKTQDDQVAQAEEEKDTKGDFHKSSVSVTSKNYCFHLHVQVLLIRSIFFRSESILFLEEIIKSGDLQWLDAFEIIPSFEIIKDIDELFPKAKLLICGDLDIGHIFPEDAVNYLRESKHENDLGSDVMQAESQHSDLLAGVYEGNLMHILLFSISRSLC